MESGELVRSLSEWDIPEVPVVALMPRRKGVAERVKVFLALLKHGFLLPPLAETRAASRLERCGK